MNKMKIKNILFWIFAATALFWAVACEKPGPNSANGDPNSGEDVTYTEINGTSLSEQNTLVGLVTDSSTGKGISGVVVSDGFSVTKTDANGVYQFPASRYAKTVFLSVPADYEIPLDANKKPAFYKVGVKKNKQNRNDFTLTPLATSEDNFTFIAIGDPQCTNEKEANRYINETMNDIVQTVSTNSKFKNPYAVTLGDIVFDAPDMWDTMKSSMSNVRLGNGSYLPIFQCVGNHDHNAKTSSDRDALADFNSHFGPTDYSFNRGKVHIVVMDDVVCTQTDNSSWDYDAGFSKSQFNWLQADIAAVDNKEDKMLILCCHIPFRDSDASGGANMNEDKYYEETLALMRQFNEAHIMIGHTHYIQNYIHHVYKTKNGNSVYEHVHGGACGGWWTSNICVTGAPNGYGIYEIEGNHMKNWIAKSTGKSLDYQMRVYNGNQTYGTTYTYNWYQDSYGGTKNIKYTGRDFLKGAFVVSLWNDDESNWDVEFEYNGQSTPMKRVTSTVMDAAAVSFFFNEKSKNTTTWTKALYHYWYIPAPEGKDPSEITGWNVKATQTIPGSGVKNVYTCGSLQTDYTGF